MPSLTMQQHLNALDRVLQGRSIAKFDHVQTDKQLVSVEEQAAQLADPKNSLKSMSEDTKRVMAKLNSADAATVSDCTGCSKP